MSTLLVKPTDSDSDDLESGGRRKPMTLPPAIPERARSGDDALSSGRVSASVQEMSKESGLPTPPAGTAGTAGTITIPGFPLPSNPPLLNSTPNTLPTPAASPPSKLEKIVTSPTTQPSDIIRTVVMSPQIPTKPALLVGSANPFNQTLGERKRRQSIAPPVERRMSMGVALCIPPTSRISAKLSFKQFMSLCSGALGIVYGEISVSPLYVLKTIFGRPSTGEDAVEFTEEEVMGAISILVWIVTLICVVKYMWLILKADKTGEGGTWALVSLLPIDDETSPLNKHRTKLITIGLLAASFLVGDVVISPAITVLSAFEGVRSNVPTFSEAGSTGVTCLVLMIVFAIQRYGTSKLQQVSGPVCILWFLSIAGIGLYNIVQTPRVLRAIGPQYVAIFVRDHPYEAFSALGHVVLSVAGVEAMYTDLGHFSAKPIRASFMTLVYPSICLSYLGQAGYIISNPGAAVDPFFESVPE
ncbi:hypothetical protein HKX48_005882 [Thoreauomyces humboldtii]|nr:hypothetical protein HKX48_005882 [Thoreauomyces humboldtii]